MTTRIRENAELIDLVKSASDVLAEVASLHADPDADGDVLCARLQRAIDISYRERMRIDHIIMGLSKE